MTKTLQPTAFIFLIDGKKLVAIPIVLLFQRFIFTELFALPELS